MIDAIQIEIHLDQFLLTGDPAHLDAAASLRGQTMKWLEAAESLAEAGRERDLLSGLRTAHRRFWSDLAAIRRRPDVEAMKPGIRDLSSRILTEQLRIPAQAYLDAKEEEVERSSARNQTMPARIGFGLLLLGVCGAAAGLLAGFGIARGISRSIAQLSVPIRDAAGKLSEVVGPLTLSPPGTSPAWRACSTGSPRRSAPSSIGSSRAGARCSARSSSPPWASWRPGSPTSCATPSPR